MVISYKLLLSDGSYLKKVLTNISSIHLSKRCLFYWFKDVEYGPFLINLSSAEDLNVVNDEDFNEMNLVGFHRVKMKGFIYEKNLHN